MGKKKLNLHSKITFTRKTFKIFLLKFHKTHSMTNFKQFSPIYGDYFEQVTLFICSF